MVEVQHSLRAHAPELDGLIGPPGNGSLLETIARLTRERDGEREAREKNERALRQKDEAMGVLMERCTRAGVDLSDLIS